MCVPKVSVVIPCCNAEKYLRQCLDSVVNQTLREIEIICINDGSKDSTLDILNEYARRDSRIVIIDKPNGGYGESMNRGFDMATGEYLGIVESDDFAELHMFETLYHCAKKDKLDVARSGYYQFQSQPGVKNTPVLPAIRAAGRTVFCPLTDIESREKQVAFFKTAPAIWSAIYRRQFIRDHHIRFNETPGASYQDTGFNFKVWVKAKRVKLIKECLLHYRTDNAASSVHSAGKVYCICDEYAEVYRFLKANGAKGEQSIPLMIRLKYEGYLWNYERLTEPLQAEFIQRFHREFRKHQLEGSLQRECFSWYDWNNLQKILLDPQRYHEIQAMKDKGKPAPDFFDAYPQHRTVKWKILYLIAENLAGEWKFIQECGLGYTVHLLINKIKNKLV